MSAPLRELARAPEVSPPPTNSSLPGADIPVTTSSLQPSQHLPNNSVMSTTIITPSKAQLLLSQDHSPVATSSQTQQTRPSVPLAAVQTRHSLYRPGQCPLWQLEPLLGKLSFCLPRNTPPLGRTGLALLTKCTGRYWIHYKCTGTGSTITFRGGRSPSNFRMGL